MALTPKQVRNGVPETPSGSGSSGQPSSSGNVAAAKGAAETYGGAQAESGRKPWTGATAGTPGYSVPDWDANIAVTEQAGEA